jgi:RHS repeat-associated protein
VKSAVVTSKHLHRHRRCIASHCSYFFKKNKPYRLASIHKYAINSGVKGASKHASSDCYSSLRTFQYDASDRLSKVILGSTFVGTDSIAGNELAAHTYLHNAAGQRVFKSEPKTEATAPSEATLGTGFVSWLRTNYSWLWQTAQTNATLGDSYLYADGNLPNWALLGEYGNGGAASTGRTEYIWLPTQDGSAIAVGLYRAGKLHAIHTDHLGTPRLMTNETNTAQWQWPYSAFGDNAPTGLLKPTTSAGSAFTSIPAAQGSGATTVVATATLLAVSSPTQINNLRFPGQYADSETGLFYNYYRTYQASQGRYTQNDPIGLAGGSNRYGYVGGNPLSFFDAMGLQPILPMPGGMAPIYPIPGLNSPAPPPELPGPPNGDVSPAPGPGTIVWPPGYSPNPQPNQCRIDVPPPNPPRPPKADCEQQLKSCMAIARSSHSFMMGTACFVAYGICKKVFQ